MSLRLRDDRKHEGKGAAAAPPPSHGLLHSGAIGVLCCQQQRQQQQDKILKLQKELETEQRNRAAHEAVVTELRELRREKERLQSENMALKLHIDRLQRGVAPTAPKAVVPAPKAVAPAPAPPKPSVKDKERKELKGRIEKETWWLGYKANEPKRDESELLTLLLDRLNKLDTTTDDKYEESDDNAKLQKLGADASEKAKELLRRRKLQLQSLYYQFGNRQGDPEGANRLRFEEYIAERPYLYVLYGGELPIPNPL